MVSLALSQLEVGGEFFIHYIDIQKQIFMKRLCVLAVVFISVIRASAIGSWPLKSEGKFFSWNYGLWTYLDSTTVTSSLELLDKYPEPGSPLFLVDEYMYFQAKLKRNTPRGQEAIFDARIGGNTILTRFIEALGMRITKNDTPELYRLLMGMKETAGTLATMHAKRFYDRIRPFMYYNERTLTPEAEPALRRDGSYPSGHSTMFYAISLVLQEICPERQVELMHRGIEGGYSRVICGAHWYSDVIAGQLLASTIVARLHAHPDFIRQLEKAKKEYQAVKYKAMRDTADFKPTRRKLPKGVD